MWLGLRPGEPTFVFTPEGLLPVPLILTFLCVTGLRGAFNLPAELRANWVFQTADSEDRVQHIRAARLTICRCVRTSAVATTRNRSKVLLGLRGSGCPRRVERLWFGDAFQCVLAAVGEGETGARDEVFDDA